MCRISNSFTSFKATEEKHDIRRRKIKKNKTKKKEEDVKSVYILHVGTFIKDVLVYASLRIKKKNVQLLRLCEKEN